MKILKGIGIVVVLLLAVYLILALFGPSNCHVERTTMVNASPVTVFDQINTLKNWKSWSYWDNIDPNMKSTYEGPESGVGAVHKWESENDSVGKGSMTITKSEPGQLVECKLEFEGMDPATSGWRIKDTTGGVLVTAYMDMDIGFIWRPMMMFMNMDEMLGSDFEKALKGLKDHCEALPSPEMTAEYVMEDGMMPAWKVLTIADSATSADIGAKYGMLQTEVGEEMKKQGLAQAGPAFAIYDKVEYNPDGSMKFWFRAGIPVDKAGKNSGRVMYWESQSGNAVKCNYIGGYSNMGPCHEAINKHITDNGKMMVGSPWEVYVTGPEKEADSTKWFTEIYYPVQ